MRIAIVDDEPACIEDISRCCRAFGERRGLELELIPFQSGEAFLRAGRGFPLVFLDIYMQGMDGIAAAQALRARDAKCLLVFLTSSPDFMPDAFSCHAFDYLVKPVSDARAARVLEDALRALPPSPRCLVLPNGRQKVSVPVETIVSVLSDAHYLEISLTDGSILRSRLTVSGFLELAAGDSRFIQINKGILVNAEFVSDFENNCCLLEGGGRFPVRVRDARKVEQAVRDYHFARMRSKQRNK